MLCYGYSYCYCCSCHVLCVPFTVLNSHGGKDSIIPRQRRTYDGNPQHVPLSRLWTYTRNEKHMRNNPLLYYPARNPFNNTTLEGWSIWHGSD